MISKTPSSALTLMFVALFSVMFYSCEKPVDPIQLPVLMTGDVSQVTENSALCGGFVSFDGGGEITAAGVCWSDSPNPTIEDSVSIDATETGEFVSHLSGLIPNTTYYIRAYATNETGTQYGLQRIFFTSSFMLTLTDVNRTTIDSAVCVSQLSYSTSNPEFLARGICWNTQALPTIENFKTVESPDSGEFISIIPDLELGTQYFVRAYITTTSGVFYSNEWNFTIPTGVIEITTSPATFIHISSATVSGEIISLGDVELTERGICLSTSAQPTTQDEVYKIDGTLGVFTLHFNNLDPSTTYYVRAYAINEVDVWYGEEQQFTTLGNKDNFVIDVDGNKYYFVTIGTQQWLMSNLITTHFRNGDLIPTTDPANRDISSEVNPIYQWQNEKTESYGRHYTWSTVTDARGLAPEGWRVPSSQDWTTLKSYIDKIKPGGLVLKEIGLAHWPEPNESTDEFGFTALPTGYRLETGTFTAIDLETAWWSSTSYGGNIATSWRLRYNSNDLIRDLGSMSRNNGLSIRCMRDL